MHAPHHSGASAACPLGRSRTHRSCTSSKCRSLLFTRSLVGSSEPELKQGLELTQPFHSKLIKRHVTFPFKGHKEAGPGMKRDTALDEGLIVLIDVHVNDICVALFFAKDAKAILPRPRLR